MGIVREPLDVDFVVDPRPLTKEEEHAISEYIRMEKEKQTKPTPSKRVVAKRKPKQKV